MTVMIIIMVLLLLMMMMSILTSDPPLCFLLFLFIYSTPSIFHLPSPSFLISLYPYCNHHTGNYFTQVWDVSNTTLAEGDVSGLWRLSLATSLIPLVPFLFLHWLPRDAQEQEDLAVDQTRSKLGGVVFLCVLAASLLWCTGSSILKLIEMT